MSLINDMLEDLAKSKKEGNDELVFEEPKKPNKKFKSYFYGAALLGMSTFVFYALNNNHEATTKIKIEKELHKLKGVAETFEKMPVNKAITLDVPKEKIMQDKPKQASLIQDNLKPKYLEEKLPELPKVTPIVKPEKAHTKIVKKKVEIKHEKALSKKERLEKNYTEAMQFLEGGFIESGLALLNANLELDNKDKKTILALASFYNQNNQYTRARNLLLQSLEHHPHDIAIVKAAAQTLVASNELRAALRIMENIPQEVTTDKEFDSFLAMINQQLGNHYEAVYIYDNLTKREPANALFWLGKGVSEEANGNKADALKSYRHAQDAIGLQPDLKQYVDTKVKELSKKVYG